MKESGRKELTQSLKRLLAVGRQKLWKLKFWWRKFVSRVIYAKEQEKLKKHLEIWTLILLPLLIVASPILPRWLFLFLFVIALGLTFLLSLGKTRFQQIYRQVLSLRPYASFVKWDEIFDRMLSEGEKAIPNLVQILQARRKLASTLEVEPASLLAIFVLGRLKAQEAVEPLIEFLRSEGVTWVEKFAAIWALGEIGNLKAIPALIPFLGDLGLTWIHSGLEWFFFRKEFARGMAVTEKEFRKQLRWKWQVRDWAEEALMKLDPKIVTLFRKVVEEQNKDALFELAREYRSEMVTALVGLLDDRQEDWVFNTVWALRELKAVDALPKLRRLARKAKSPLRDYCQKVIAELEEFSRLPRAVGVGETEMANLPAIPDPNAIPTENLPRPAAPEENSD